jgi:hypothetical protein
MMNRTKPVRVYTTAQKITKALYNKRYYREHLDEFKAQDRVRYKRLYATPDGKAKILRRNRTWQKQNREKMRAISRAWLHEHPLQAAETRKKWYKKNIDKLRAYNRKWTVDRRANDLNARIKHRLRTRLRCALLLQSAPKRCSVLSLVGCSLPELKVHIERQFKHGMSWKRIREIDIDHKRPCCTFDLTELRQQRACFHFSNLQPLWAPDNRRKRHKILA